MDYSNFSLLSATMKSLMQAVLVAVLMSLTTATPAEDREGRSWLFGGDDKPVTKVYIRKHFTTEYLPSSCVVVQPSLQGCKNLRALDIEPEPTIQTTRIEPTKLAVLKPEDRDGRTFWPTTAAPPLRRYHKVESSNEPTPEIELEEIEHLDMEEAAKPTTEPPHRQTWSEMLGFSKKENVVSKFVDRTITSTIVDPSLVVTFSVTGCEPTRLPFDLEFCDKSKVKISRGKDNNMDKLKEVNSPHTIHIIEAN